MYLERVTIRTHIITSFLLMEPLKTVGKMEVCNDAMFFIYANYAVTFLSEYIIVSSSNQQPILQCVKCSVSKCCLWWSRKEYKLGTWIH